MDNYKTTRSTVAVFSSVLKVLSRIMFNTDWSFADTFVPKVVFLKTVPSLFLHLVTKHFMFTFVDASSCGKQISLVP